jgi:hypothetical protein
MSAVATESKMVIGPGTDFAKARESITTRLDEAEAERADVERNLYEVQAESDPADEKAQAEIASLSRQLVTLDVRVRSLRGALPVLDKSEAEAKAAAEVARLAGVQQKLERAVVALDKATAKLADDVLLFAASLDAAKRAEEKCSGLGGQVGQALLTPSVLQRVRFAMFRSGYNEPALTSLDLPSGWNKLDAIAAMREPRRLRKTVPSPAILGSGPRKVAAEVLLPPTK